MRFGNTGRRGRGRGRGRDVRHALEKNFHVSNSGEHAESKPEAVARLTECRLDRTINYQSQRLFLCTQRAAPYAGTGAGRIIKSGSGCKQGVSEFLTTPRASDRNAFTKAAQVELGSTRITVKLRARRRHWKFERTKNTSRRLCRYMATAGNALGRWASTVDVEPRGWLLRSDAAAFIYGFKLCGVDGGLFK